MFKNFKKQNGVHVLSKEALNNIVGQGITYYCINSNGNGAYTDMDISGNGVHCFPVADVLAPKKSALSV